MITDKDNLTAHTPKTEAGIVYPLLCGAFALCVWFSF